MAAPTASEESVSSPYPPNSPQQPYQPVPPPQQFRVIRTGGARHGMHALITLFTCGLWLPVWVLAWLFSKKHKTAVPR